MQTHHCGDSRSFQAAEVTVFIRSFHGLTGPCARLSCRMPPTGERLDYGVRMGSTQPHYGGRRWWFLCPAIEAGCTCERRVQKLYRPPGTKYFMCRHCWGLSYASQRKNAVGRALAKVQRGASSEDCPPD